MAGVARILQRGIKMSALTKTFLASTAGLLLLCNIHAKACPSFAPKAYPNCKIDAVGAIPGLSAEEAEQAAKSQMMAPFEVVGASPSDVNLHEFKFSVEDEVVDARNLRNDSENAELYYLSSFKNGRSIRNEIGDVGITAIELKDVCIGSEAVKQQRTILDPTRPLEFPLIDARRTYAFNNNSVTITVGHPDVSMPANGRLTQAMLDNAPLKILVKYTCSTATP